MMRHPFHGVNQPAESSQPMAERIPTGPHSAVSRRGRSLLQRRAFFAHSLAAVAGAGALLVARAVSAQTPPDTRGMGFPEGGALQGGYGGAVRSGAGQGGTVTTFAVGEEGGGRVTTFAIGEEGGRVTTQAVGEEGGYYPRRRRRPRRVTTYAVGEEGGSYPRQRYTTYAIGEEG
jgi:hypothetical protein